MVKKKTKIETFEKKPGFFQKKRNIILIIGAIALIGWIVYGATKEEVLTIRTETVSRSDLIQEVSVTGSVKPAEKVSLGFEVSGKVAEIYANVGDRVEAGDKLISLASNDLTAQLRQAQAGVSSAAALRDQYKAAVDAQQAKLDELKSGTRPEEIQIVETTVKNAEITLADARTNYENTKIKVEADMQNTLNSARNSMLIAVESGKSALLTLADAQWKSFAGESQEAYYLENVKEEAVYELLGARNAGSWLPYSIAKLNGGVYGEAHNLPSDASMEEVQALLTKATTALQKVRIALNAFPISINLDSAVKTTLETEKNSINNEINTLTGHQQSISVQQATSDNLVSTAEIQINTAENNLASAQDQLNLKKAGATADQIKAQEAMVNQAKASLASQNASVSQAYANMQNYQAQLDKTILYAPIAGLITKMEAKVGEIVFPSSPYSDSRTTFVSIISDTNYEIEASIAEVDIAKIKVGNSSRVTLDAYGDNMEFEAVVTNIDPAETIIEGIPTYKVTLQFTEDAEEIKSGMTANLDILTEKLENVLSIPQRAVIEKDGKKIVRLYHESMEPVTDESQLDEREVITGLKNSEGRIEIIDGVQEGDIVVISAD